MQVGYTAYSAHKVILAANVPYFQNMFNNNFPEKNQEILPICEVNPE